MRKNILYLSILISVLGVSCSKFLDREPISVSTDPNFWQNEKEADIGVASSYSLLRAALNETDGLNLFAHGDFAADEFSNITFNTDVAAVNQMNLALTVPITETTRYMLRFRRFDFFYRAIDQANRCMKFIPTIPLDKYTAGNPEAVQQRLIAEAYFVRAFTYFYMARVWGNVPVVLETVADPSTAGPVPQSPQNVVLDQCIKDLEYAIPRLTWTFPVASDRAVRANRASAFALLAHIYAWRGEYDKCAAAADSVIQKGGFTLVNRNSYLTIFNGKSSEGIFEIAQNAANEGYGNGIAFRTLKGSYLETNQGNSQLPLDRVALFERFFTDSGKVDLRAKNGFAFLTTADPICIKYSGNITYTATTSTGQRTSPIARHNLIIFRLSDIMLLRAEALAATGNFGAARTILNEIRGMANLAVSTATDNELFEAIIDERGRELFLEGHRFYDLVRLGKKTGIMKFTAPGATVKLNEAEFQAGKYMWPIDPYLIYVNPHLEQTPFWRDKM